MERRLKNNPAAPIGARGAKDRIEQMSEVRHFNKRELDQLKLLYQGVDNENLLKVFRELRTRLNTYADGENYVCMVTSMVAGGGSSYVAMNLASAVALDRTKTSLYIDANLYAPSGEALLPVESQLGLTDYLDDPTMGVEQIVYASGIPRVRVVPVGNNRDGGTEKITSERMQAFMTQAKTRYSDRYVFVDAPPVGDYGAEIRILSELCDFVVLVVPYGKVTSSQIKTVTDSLGDRLAGIVFNNT